MITKNKSGKIKQLKYLLLIPLLLGMLVYSSCTDEINDELTEMETVLSQYDTSEGNKYFDFEVGKTFIGSSLMIGRYLELDEYTTKEKELHDKFNKLEGSMFDYIVLIDANDERVNWFRPKSLRLESKNEWKYVEGETVPFAKIEEVPIYPGCEEGSQEELRACLQENITKHVNKNFNVDLAKNLNLSPGTKRIFVMFEIDKEGNVVNVQSRAPHQSLADEAIRVVNSLPKMIPGKYSDKNVSVKYSLPIAFKIAGKNENNKENLVKNSNIKIDTALPFSEIDEVPIFPGCEGTENELRQCLQERITDHVYVNFNVDLAKNLGLSPGVQRIFVMFKIDKDGSVTDADARGPHQSLADEAIRVVNSLPKMIPGKQQGENVEVKYSLPIAFKVE